MFPKVAWENPIVSLYRGTSYQLEGNILHSSSFRLTKCIFFRQPPQVQHELYSKCMITYKKPSLRSMITHGETFSCRYNVVFSQSRRLLPSLLLGGYPSYWRPARQTRCFTTVTPSPYPPLAQSGAEISPRCGNREDRPRAWKV